MQAMPLSTGNTINFLFIWSTCQLLHASSKPVEMRVKNMAFDLQFEGSRDGRSSPDPNGFLRESNGIKTRLKLWDR